MNSLVKVLEAVNPADGLTETFAWRQWTFTTVKAPAVEMRNGPRELFDGNRLTVNGSGIRMDFSPRDLMVCSQGCRYIDPIPYEIEANPDQPFTLCPNYEPLITATLLDGDRKFFKTDETLTFPYAAAVFDETDIKFYDAVPLFSEDPHTTGQGKAITANVRLRCSPDFWFILMKHEMEIKNRIVRRVERRYYHKFGEEQIVQEMRWTEAGRADPLVVVSSLKVDPLFPQDRW